MPTNLPPAQRKCPPSQVKATASVVCTLAMIMTAGNIILFGALTAAMNYEQNVSLQRKRQPPLVSDR